MSRDAGRRRGLVDAPGSCLFDGQTAAKAWADHFIRQALPQLASE